MKFTYKSLILLLLVSTSIAKNVANLDRFKLIEVNKRDAAPDAKNIANIDRFKNHINKRKSNQESDQKILNNKESPMVVIPSNMELPKIGTTLNTQLTQNNRISIFAGYIRDSLDVASRANNKEKSTIIITPTNEALESLSSKPWEFPNEIKDSESDEVNDGLIKKNIESFIKSHIIDEDSSIFEKSKDFNTGVTTKTENGTPLYLKFENTEFYVSTDSKEWIKIDDIKIVDNGAILVIGKSLSKP